MRGPSAGDGLSREGEPHEPLHTLAAETEVPPMKSNHLVDAAGPALMWTGYRLDVAGGTGPYHWAPGVSSVRSGGLRGQTQ
jgi:hypothetical protein